MIEILLNGKAFSIEDGATLSDLIDTINIKMDGTAIAVDGAIVPKSKIAECILHDDNHVDIIRAVGGG